VVLKETELQPGKIGAEVSKDDPNPYPNSAGGTGNEDDGKKSAVLPTTTSSLPLNCTGPRNV
jgi:hypothetical protein